MLNYTSIYRPLRGGVAILNPNVGRPGTLGCFVRKDGRVFVLSSYHVLVRGDDSNGAEDEPIFQPNDQRAPHPVASVRLALASLPLDAAAAELANAIVPVPETLNLPKCLGVLEPLPGMRVLKSSATTGVTEGIVARVADGLVRINAPAGFPRDYDISDHGDSGAVWFERDSMKAVVLHGRGSDPSGVWAEGRAFPQVLAGLGVTLFLG